MPQKTDMPDIESWKFILEGIALPLVGFFGVTGLSLDEVFSFTDFQSRQHLDGQDLAPEQAGVIRLLHSAADSSAHVRQCHHCDHLYCLFTSENNAGDPNIHRVPKV